MRAGLEQQSEVRRRRSLGMGVPHDDQTAPLGKSAPATAKTII
jgi:hypothetical protein